MTLIEIIKLYITSVQTEPCYALFLSFVISYIIFYILGISYYAATHFIIEWKIKMWEVAPESQVIEEIKYIIRKHNQYANLNTLELIIAESINLTKYNVAYRIECFRQGLKARVKTLENV